MKKLSKIKLNQFSKDELDRRKLNALKGGCGCHGCYKGCATSSEMDVRLEMSTYMNQGSYY